MQAYSANAPGTDTPNNSMFLQICFMPWSQNQQWLQGMWDSQETRSPTFRSVTFFAYGYNVACGLMADDQRGFGVDLAPLVPFHDVHVCAAEGGTMDLDEYLVVAGFRDGEIRPIDEPDDY